MNLAHLLDFDFQCNELGSLRIGSLGKHLRNSIETEVERGEVDANDLAKRVFVGSAHHATGIKAIDSVCGGPAVALEDVAKLDQNELEEFAERYGAHFFGKNNGKAPTAEEPRGAHYLIFQIGESARLRQESGAKLLARIKSLRIPPTMPSYMRDADFAAKFVSARQFDAGQKALVEQERWEKIRRAVDPFEQVRRSLGPDTSWQNHLIGFAKPTIETDRLSKIIDESSAIAKALKSFHATASWETSLRHAQSSFSFGGIGNHFLEAQKAYSNIQSQWRLPRYLVESISSLTALEAQIGLLTLPVIDWNSAAALASYLGPQGLLDELASLGIDENGDLTGRGKLAGDGGYVSPKVRDLLLLLSIIAMFLVPMYQEWSSAQSAALLEGKAGAQMVVLERQAKQLESLSRLVEAAIVNESTRAPIRFVVLDRDATVYRHPESGAQKDGRLLPREVVNLVSEKGKWIEVRYYHWLLKDYQTGWVLKKYFARVPASHIAEE